jgi:hypothetical protein
LEVEEDEKSWLIEYFPYLEVVLVTLLLPLKMLQANSEDL